MVLLKFFSDIILPVALGPWVRLSLQQKRIPGVFPGVKGGRCVKLTTLPACCALFVKSGKLNFLEPSGPLQASNGTALPLPLTQLNIYYYGLMVYFKLLLPATSFGSIYSSHFQAEILFIDKNIVNSIYYLLR